MAEPRRAAATVPRFEGGRFLIVEARYYDAIGADLLAGATRAIEAAGATYDLVSVAGALEIPAGMAIALDAAKAAGRPYDGAVALGCVIRGETFHFEIVAGESARALMDMSVERRLPLGNGILTTETIEQAEERADPERGDKGGDAARAAIGLAHLARRLGHAMKRSDKRSAARLAASQALYQMEITGKGVERHPRRVRGPLDRARDRRGRLYARRSGVLSRRGVGRLALPGADRPQPRRHARQRLAAQAGRSAHARHSARRALRIAQPPGRAARVAVTEYVDVAVAFFGPEESGMINAVLDALARQTRPAEFASNP